MHSLLKTTRIYKTFRSLITKKYFQTCNPCITVSHCNKHHECEKNKLNVDSDVGTLQPGFDSSGDFGIGINSGIPMVNSINITSFSNPKHNHHFDQSKTLTSYVIESSSYFSNSSSAIDSDLDDI